MKFHKKLYEVSSQLCDFSCYTSSLENRVNLIENHLSNVETSGSLGEAVIYEDFDRQSRSRNLIIFNAPESNNNTSEKDVSLIKSLFDSSSLNVISTIVSRLGRKSVNHAHLKLLYKNHLIYLSYCKININYMHLKSTALFVYSQIAS